MQVPRFHLRRTERAASLPARRPLSDSPEGRMLQIGLLLGIGVLVALGLGWHFLPEQTLVFAAMVGLNLLIGRAAGMTFGYASDLEHHQVIPVNMLMETIQVLVIYPLFVLSVQNLLDLPRLRPMIARMRAAGEVRHGTVRRFGIAGVFVFVFIPFWMTGPVAGSVIGYLIGLRPWVNVAVVLSATYAAIGFWALLVNEPGRWAAADNRPAPLAPVLATVLLALAARLIRRRRDNGHAHDTPEHL